MNEAICKFMEKSSRGTVHHMAALRTKLDLPGGRQGQAWICATENQLWIAAVQEGLGKAIPAPINQLALTKNFWGVAIKVGEQPYAIPISGSSAVKEVIAAARLHRSDRTVGETTAYDGPFIQNLEPHWRQWLHNNLFVDETLIAFLETADKATMTPLISGASSANYHFILTDRRCGLLAVSDLGDQGFLPLKREALIVEKSLGWKHCQCGDQTWKSTIENGKAFESIAPLIPLEPSARLREAALLYFGADKNNQSETAKQIHSALLIDQDPFNHFIGAWWSEKTNPGTALSVLMKDPKEADHLAKWCKRCNFDANQYETLLSLCAKKIIHPEDAEWSLPLHDLMRKQFPNSLDTVSAFQKELEYIEHLLYAGQKENAGQRAKQLIHKSPVDSVHCLFSNSATDLFSLGSAPYIKQRAIQLSLSSRHNSTNLMPEDVFELAKCQPLNKETAKAMTSIDKPDERKKGRLLLDLINGNGWRRSVVTKKDGSSQPLTQDNLSTLFHPTLQKEGPLFKTHDWLHDVQEMAYGDVKYFCDEITPSSHPEVWNTISGCCKRLRMKPPKVFEFRGERSIGIACHSNPEVILGIGSSHLNPASPWFMTETEIRAAIGSALFALNNNFHKLLSEEKWRKIIENNTEINAELVSTCQQLPLDWMQAYPPLKGRIYSPHEWLMDQYGVENLTDYLNISGFQNMSPSSDNAPLWVKAVDWLGIENRDEWSIPVALLACYRAVTLSKDRAALALSGDLNATLRSMLLSTEAGEKILNDIQKYGLYKALRTPRTTFAKQNAAIRIHALVLFAMNLT